MESIRALARHVDIPERTLRRAAAEGLIRGERSSARRYRTSMREEQYLRRHWPLLRELRDALRTEPNVRMAILFGSFATGEASERSDIDLLVSLADPGAPRLAELAGRVERRLGCDVQLVRVVDAERSPVLMATALEHGRVLVDRDGLWEPLKRREAHWRRRAAASETPLEEALGDLELP